MTTKPPPDELCPCCSLRAYKECCEPFHAGKAPATALLLMRSRYSAYALGLVEYLINTTHPSNPYYNLNHNLWKKQILEFTQSTKFEGLEILDFIDGINQSFVTFFAKLSHENQDTSFEEKSHFEKIDGRWLYHHGILNNNSKD